LNRQEEVAKRDSDDLSKRDYDGRGKTPTEKLLLGVKDEVAKRDNGIQRGNTSTEKLLQIIDTTLLKCYIEVGKVLCPEMKLVAL